MMVTYKMGSISPENCGGLRVGSGGGWLISSVSPAASWILTTTSV